MKFDLLDLKYDVNGLIFVIVQDVENGDVLMMVWMNVEVVVKMFEIGCVIYWLWLCQLFWVKGDILGYVQELVEFIFDCDSDCIFVKVC